MEINLAGLNLIKSFESLRLDAYLCPAGVPTIGYGHTGAIRLGMTITEEEAEWLLDQDLKKFESGVTAQVKVEMTCNQFSALVSFAFNCGLENFAKSTLLAKLNAGDLISCSSEFLRWIKVDGEISHGLIRRRAAERALFDLK